MFTFQHMVPRGGIDIRDTLPKEIRWRRHCHFRNLCSCEVWMHVLLKCLHPRDSAKGTDLGESQASSRSSQEEQKICLGGFTEHQFTQYFPECSNCSWGHFIPGSSHACAWLSPFPLEPSCQQQAWITVTRSTMGGHVIAARPEKLIPGYIWGFTWNRPSHLKQSLLSGKERG